MKKIFFSILWFLSLKTTAFAVLVWDKRKLESAPVQVENTGDWFFSWGFSFMYTFLFRLVIFSLLVLVVLFLIKIIRFLFELYYAKNLRYLKVTVPRADSKLDKEKETKKDFKEKIWMMSMFYKAIHKLSEAWLKDTFLNMLFKHSKISLELVYENAEVTFFIVTYKSYVNLVTQHLTSVYTDAEVLVVDKKDYINIKPKWYSMRWASLWKEEDDVYPIKTFKYLEDDPINNFANVFGWLNKEDKAVFQIVIKPEFAFNKKAKRAAGLVAKWKYKKSKKNIFSMFGFLRNPIVAMISWPEDMVWSNNAPWASEWDAYKIFNQAETEAQKIMWEAAGQPFFTSSIRILVSSKEHQVAENWVHAIVAAASIFTDEYNNSLDNPQVREDALPFIFTPLRYFWFKYKLVWFFQNVSYFSIDEISTLFHLPDITYNRSPIINWLEYKKLPTPHNLLNFQKMLLF